MQIFEKKKTLSKIIKPLQMIMAMVLCQRRRFTDDCKRDNIVDAPNKF